MLANFKGIIQTDGYKSMIPSMEITLTSILLFVWHMPEDTLSKRSKTMKSTPTTGWTKSRNSICSKDRSGTKRWIGNNGQG
jgi:hypothetical protein